MKHSKLLLSALALSISLSSLPSQSSVLPFVNAERPIDSLAPMLEQVLPAVVTIYVEGTQKQTQRIPEEFKFFFGPGFPSERENTKPFEGLGSGVILNAEKGYIVTNAHVINNANKIRIQLNDGKEFEAKLLGMDQPSDIAVLQIIDLKEAKDLRAVKFADSDQLRVGDFSVAIGNPFGIGQTATSGIISAVGRSGLNVQGLENFIQTDASINRGNSGGALVNLKGELVGLNTAIIAPSGGNVGIGFAIPSNMVNSLSQQIIQFGEVRRAQLGILGGEMTAEMAKALKIDTQRGAFVSKVTADSAAAKAGIKPGDVIVSFEGQPIHSFASLRAKVAIAGAGRKVNIGVLRDGKMLNMIAELQKSEDESTSAQSLTQSLSGATLSNSEQRGNSGVVVEDIENNSPAYKAGLRKGDFIIAVNRERVTSINDLRKITERKPKILAVNIVRGNEQIYLIMQ